MKKKRKRKSKWKPGMKEKKKKEKYIKKRHVRSSVFTYRLKLPAVGTLKDTLKL
jgi:hypothetical protein